MNIKVVFRNNIKTIKNIIQSVLENDFFGMASEMGFMLCIGICPFILFPVIIFLRGFVPASNIISLSPQFTATITKPSLFLLS